MFTDHLEKLGEHTLCCCSYPLAFFRRRCSWTGAWMWPLGALSPVSFAHFGGGWGRRGGRRRRGSCVMGGRHGGWRVRRSTVWRGWRWRPLLLLDRRWGVICEKRLKGHGGSLEVFFLLLGWRVLWHPWSPWKHRGKWKSQRVQWIMGNQEPSLWKPDPWA